MIDLFWLVFEARTNQIETLFRETIQKRIGILMYHQVKKGYLDFSKADHTNSFVHAGNTVLVVLFKFYVCPLQILY